MPKIEREGVKVHYEDHGDGPPLVLLHGFLFNSDMWAPQVEELRKQFRIITVDFRGHGRSSIATEPFTLYELVSDVVAVLIECGVRRAVWIGLSMGGMVSMRAAIVSPETVEALVLLDTDAGPEDPLKRLRYRAMGLGARIFGIAPFLPSIGRLTFGATTRRENKDLVREWKRRFRALHIPSVRTTLEAITRRDSIRPMLHEINVPTLVISGEEDETLSLPLSRQIAEGIAGARVETIPRAGHMSNLERPELVNELLRDFLARLPLSRPDADPADQGRPVFPPRDLAIVPLPETDTGEAAGAEIEMTPAQSNPVGDEPDERLIEDAAAPASPPPKSQFAEYAPPKVPSSEAAEFMLPGGRKGRERRGMRRVAPSRKLYGRVGHVGILLIDISESGAKMEHYNRRFATGSTIALDLEWEGRTLSVECEVMSCRVNRFMAGEKGATVYQSGVLFRRMSSESSKALRELVSRLVTRGLAEQVANARGLGPVMQRDMPTFRSGVVDSGGRPKEAGSEGPSRLIRNEPAVSQPGYIRCRKNGPRWEKKWTTDPGQPQHGFTVLASENKLNIDALCETWDRGDAAARKFIQDCARASLGIEPDQKE